MVVLRYKWFSVARNYLVNFISVGVDTNVSKNKAINKIFRNDCTLRTMACLQRLLKGPSPKFKIPFIAILFYFRQNGTLLNRISKVVFVNDG